MYRFAPLVLISAMLGWAQPLPLVGIAHVGYRVSDPLKTHAFYTDVLGFQRAFQVSGAGFYKVDDDQYVEIEGGLKAQDNTRLTHIALQTSDLEETRRLLKARGFSTKGTVTAPEGTRIHFVQYTKGAKETGARGRFLEAARLSGHLQRTGVIVPRKMLEQVVRFYTTILGCDEILRDEPTPGDVRTVQLQVPGDRHDVIELMVHSGKLTRDQIGAMHHIHFEVPDIHAAYRFVRGHEAKRLTRPRVNAENVWSFDILDPDGSRIAVRDPAKIPMASIHEESFHGRRAWVLSNGLMRVSVLAGGGHIAEVRLTTGDAKKDVNPLRIPHYPTIEPQEYDDAKHNAIYGSDPHRWFSSGYMGHLLCFPEYGPPSKEEAEAGMANHGEAAIVEWRKSKVDSNSDGVTLWYGADLPKSQYRVERAITLLRGMKSIRVQEWVENLTPSDRPVNWMQHATFGTPFIEPGKSVLDTSATRAKSSSSEFIWPVENGVDVRVFPTTPHSGSYKALLMDPARSEQFFTLYHPDFHVLVGYTFPAAGNPWLADWQENQSMTHLPWNGQVIARGIEFGSSPYAEGLRKSVERGSLFGAPAYRWIGGKQRIGTEYSIFLEEIPDGFAGVKDVRFDDGVPMVSRR